MIDITVKVPEDRVSEFYANHATFLKRPVPVEPPTDLPPHGDAEYLPWTDADGALAAIVWDKLTDTAKGLFSTLIDNPGQRYNGDQLSEMLGIPNGRKGVAGMLGYPGGYCYAVNRTRPWSWSDSEDGEHGVYWFTPEVAQVFSEARER